jgi:hypothetical protein
MKAKKLLSAGPGKKDKAAPPKKGEFIDVQKRTLGKFDKNKKKK